MKIHINVTSNANSMQVGQIISILKWFMCDNTFRESLVVSIKKNYGGNGKRVQKSVFPDTFVNCAMQ